MSVNLPPIPIREISNLPYVFQEWLRKLNSYLSTYGLTPAENALLTGVKPANKVLAGPTTGADALATYRSLVANDIPTVLNAITPVSVKPNANGYLSSDASVGISTTITTASLVGKTITVKDGIITGFS